ncbi:MAG: hypothetical protein UDH96_02415, partial [Megasphaera elsdenii]|nr:hypothetical protein [Megasphaera elsdenii]
AIQFEREYAASSPHLLLVGIIHVALAGWNPVSLCYTVIIPHEPTGFGWKRRLFLCSFFKA